MDGSVSGSRRRQWIALILSGVIPGLGQLFLGAWGKGVAFLLAGGVLTWALGDLVSMEDLLSGRLIHPLVTLALVLALSAVFLWSVWTPGALEEGLGRSAGISGASPRRAVARLVNADPPV